MKLAILQRVIKPYRIPLFEKLSQSSGVELMIFYGDNVPGTKTKGIKSPPGFQSRELPTKNFSLPGRKLTWHIGLTSALKEFSPDVILCEAESHFLGYLQALRYRRKFSPETGLVYWCFISLPGRPISEYGFKPFLKRVFRKQFDSFVLYSTFSQQSLMKLGYSTDSAFVATNVGDVRGHLTRADNTKETKKEARSLLRLPDRFTVLYVGTIDANKKPELLLRLAGFDAGKCMNFVLCGSGSMLNDLQDEVKSRKLDNVYLPGRVGDQLPLYYRSADVLVIPGRGGIVISEAMAFRLPVVVHEADGTENDLVINGVTGLHLPNGGAKEFEDALCYLRSEPSICKKYGEAGRDLVESKFTTENMANQIKRAAQYAFDSRNFSKS